ncbi:DUF5719 family protein [Flaviflexus equikiangi]|uniref:DUF5719 family protein n=1 Tax=Flaviflexus equikiangi TaxID=2758573 RepID=UPI0015F7198C|nr:DUF5719 family protein [Flaviflexus equikiangi]
MRILRIMSGLSAIALGGGGLAIALLGPGAEVTASPAIRAAGTAREISLACPPDFEETMGETVGLDGEESDPRLRTRAIVVGGGDAALDDRALPAGESRTFFEAGAFPGELTVEPLDTPVLAAASTQRFQDSGELAGLALTPCIPPVNVQYLVGGSTSASSSAQLVLTNVTGSPATVTVTVHTSTGTADTSVLSTVAVDAHSSHSMILEAGVRDDRIAVEIASTGGQIASHLFVHEIDGISGAGIESVTPGAEPATTTIVPGADLSGENGSVELRVANPGSERATVSISAITAEGIEDVPGAQDVVLAPGTVLDLSMDGLAGAWSALRVEADVPVLAGARITSEGDYGWLASSSASTRSAVSVPESVSHLTLYSDEPTTALVTSLDREGNVLESETVTVSPIAAITSPDDTSFITIESETPIHAGILALKDLDTMIGIAGLSTTVPPAASNDLVLRVID